MIGIPSNSKKIKEEEEFKILETKKGEKIFHSNEFPEFSKEELFLIKAILEKFRQEETGNKKLVENAIEKYCDEHSIELDEEQKEYIPNALKKIVNGFGPLSVFLENESIEEIACIGLGEEKPIHVYHKIFGWMKTNLYYSNEKTVKNIVNKMARKVGKRLSMHSPRLNAMLPDGSRVNSLIAPASFSGPNFTVRKFRKKPFMPSELIQSKTISAEACALLWMAMQTDLNLIVCGNTGSGKTTTLNSLFEFVPLNERIIITEETPEINVPHSHKIKLKACEEQGIGLNELVYETLRMRPDRVIVGEVRNGNELRALVDTMLAGQGKGSYATFHALNAKECIRRMVSLGT